MVDGGDGFVGEIFSKFGDTASDAVMVSLELGG